MKKIKSTLSLFICWLFIATSTSAKDLFPAKPDCLNRVLESIASNKKLGTDLKATHSSAARYNDEIFKKASTMESSQWKKSVDSAIDEFATYDTRMNAAEFKEFIRKNPGTVGKEETIGSYLNGRYQSYKQLVPETDLVKVADDLPNELRKIGKECKESQICHEKKIGGYLMRKINGTCLGKNKGEAVRSMVTGLALTSVGLYAGYASNPEAGYGWDVLASTAFWTPILSEMGCRNTLAKGEIGNKIDFGQISRMEKLKAGANNYVQYMVLSPLTNVTYAAFHTVQQVARGEKQWKDVDLAELGLQVASLSAWDAIYPVPRMVLITDPLYMKGLPKLRNFAYRKIPTKFAAEGSYLIADFGTRIGINFINTLMFQQWLKTSDQFFNTHFLPPVVDLNEVPEKTVAPSPSPQK